MKILIRTDASVEIGSGHLMRCLTLADQLRNEGAEVAFICRDLPGGMFDLLNDCGYQNERISWDTMDAETWQHDAEKTIEAATRLFPSGIDWLVVDHYELDSTWESRMRPMVRGIVVIDDLANRLHDCDLLLDQNYYRHQEQRYRGLVPEQCVTLLGPAYVLLRPEFVEARQQLRARDGTVKRILLFFGGSDQVNQTQAALEALRLLERPDIEVDVVVGSANPNRNEIQALCDELPWATFHCQVSNMAELILNADLGIGAGGVAMWERCYLGLPALTVVSAANQEQATKDAAEIGIIEYLGRFEMLGTDDYAQAVAVMLGNPQRVWEIGSVALKALQSGGSSLAENMQRILEHETDCMTDCAKLHS